METKETKENCVLEWGQLALCDLMHDLNFHLTNNAGMWLSPFNAQLHLPLLPQLPHFNWQWLLLCHRYSFLGLSLRGGNTNGNILEPNTGAQPDNGNKPHETYKLLEYIPQETYKLFE